MGPFSRFHKAWSGRGLAFDTVCGSSRIPTAQFTRLHHGSANRVAPLHGTRAVARCAGTVHWADFSHSGRVESS